MLQDPKGGGTFFSWGGGWGWGRLVTTDKSAKAEKTLLLAQQFLDPLFLNIHELHKNIFS